jgi:hypothetical protein
VKLNQNTKKTNRKCWSHYVKSRGI